MPRQAFNFQPLLVLLGAILVALSFCACSDNRPVPRKEKVAEEGAEGPLARELAGFEPGAILLTSFAADDGFVLTVTVPVEIMPDRFIREVRITEDVEEVESEIALLTLSAPSSRDDGPFRTSFKLPATKKEIIVTVKGSGGEEWIREWSLR